jgi:ethylmalonyl-CoA mutase
MEAIMAEKTTDKPWLFRTYAGHSTAQKSNMLYKSNLSKGQTGLSVAFDLPTQTGYDSDHLLARGEVGKVGVPIAHLGDMEMLFADIPLATMNTSMTINAVAPWLLALYISVADKQGAERRLLQGTTQNDILKEYLSRGTYIFPPKPSLRLTKDVILFTTKEMPKWNPMNVCSYHLQEAGATPEQELAFALANAIAILEEVRGSGQVQEMGEVVSRISFFVNAGMKFITEMCKMRAFAEMWEEIVETRFGVHEARQKLFRYGVQVNSLGLTEQQPENNVYRILIEALAVTLSKKARCRALQLPAWNEALGLPRAFDQQWSLRIQQILAYETDLLDYEDIFEGSPVIAAKVNALKLAAYEEIKTIDAMGGAVAAIENSYMKEQLVAANAARLENIENGKQVVIGVNRYLETEPSPLTTGDDAVMTINPLDEAEQIARLNAWRGAREAKAVQQALQDLTQAAKEGRNIMPPSIAAAKAGVTTGEWAFALRGLYGDYRAPTGVSTAMSNDKEELQPLRDAVNALSLKLKRRLTFLVGKPGLDGHSNGAEQIAVRARDCGMEVLYEGIRLTPSQIIATAKKANVHVIGLSILSGSHVSLVLDMLEEMKAEGLTMPLVLGGIIPDEDAQMLKNKGVAAIYTPKDFKLNFIMQDIVQLVDNQLTSGKN